MGQLGTLVLFLVLLGSQTWGSPQGLSYQGRIVKSTGDPLQYHSVSFLFQITDPSGQCVIYQEQINGINMTNSQGVFDVPIGQGTITYPTTGTFKILDAFDNTATYVCQGGLPYTASQGDLRKLKVQFNDGVGWNQITPDSIIRSVPYAGYASNSEKLGSHLPIEFLLKSSFSACPANNFLTYNGNDFSCAAVSGLSGGTVTKVTSTNAYLTVDNETSTPSLSLNVGVSANSLAAGNDSRILNALQSGSTAGGDLSGAYPNPQVTKIQGTAVSSSSPTLSGQVLKYNGSAWAASKLNYTELTNSLGTNPWPSVSCGANQFITWSSASDSFTCASVSTSPSSFGTQSANTFLAAPSASSGTPIFRSITSTDLPAGAYDSSYFSKNGNSFGADATLGTNDNYNLSLKTGNVARVTVNTSGSVGVGKTNPTSMLDVNGEVRMANSGATCSAAIEGAQKYNSALKRMEFCDGASWISLSPPQHQKLTFSSCNTTVTTNSGGYVTLCSSTFTATKSGVAKIEVLLEDVYLITAGSGGNLGFKLQLNSADGLDYTSVFLTSIYRFGSGAVFFPPIIDRWNVTAGTSYTLTLLYFTQSLSGGITINTHGNSSLKVGYIEIY